MTRFELVQQQREEILHLANIHGVRKIRIFGSTARGDDHPSSDIDFLVDMEPGRSLLDMGGLLMDLQDLLGINVDLVTEKGLRPRFKEQVLIEPIDL